MIIYLAGCEACGVNAVYIRAIKKHALKNNINLEIRNSKYDKTYRMEHVDYLKKAGFTKDKYQPILVEGDKITRLREWNS